LKQSEVDWNCVSWLSVTDQETFFLNELTTVFADWSKHLTRTMLDLKTKRPKPTDVSSSMNRAAELVL